MISSQALNFWEHKPCIKKGTLNEWPMLVEKATKTLVIQKASAWGLHMQAQVVRAALWPACSAGSNPPH